MSGSKREQKGGKEEYFQQEIAQDLQAHFLMSETFASSEAS